MSAASDIAPLFAGEVQFGGWRDSHRSGPSITLFLQDADALEAFRGLTARKGNAAGHRFMLACVEIGDDEKPVQPVVVPATDREPKGHRYGLEARALVTSGFFNPSNLRVLNVIGTDAEYQDWCRKRPSALCGPDDFDPVTGEIRNEPAHVRRAGESGTGHKPLFATIPLTHAQHAFQHQHGEAACLDKFKPGACSWDQADAAIKFDTMRATHVLSWAKTKLARIFEVESIGDIEPAALYDWGINHGIANFLPAVYRS